MYGLETLKRLNDIEVEKYQREKKQRELILKITGGIDPADLQEMAEREGWDD